MKKQKKKNVMRLLKKIIRAVTQIQKTIFFGTRVTVGPESSQGEKEKESITSRGTSKQLNIWYDNCGVLAASKLHELSLLILIENPDVVCLSEVTPKNFQRTLTLLEYSIFGYFLMKMLGECSSI